MNKELLSIYRNKRSQWNYTHCSHYLLTGTLDDVLNLINKTMNKNGILTFHSIKGSIIPLTTIEISSNISFQGPYFIIPCVYQDIESGLFCSQPAFSRPLTYLCENHWHKTDEKEVILVLDQIEKLQPLLFPSEEKENITLISTLEEKEATEQTHQCSCDCYKKLRKEIQNKTFHTTILSRKPKQLYKRKFFFYLFFLFFFLERFGKTFSTSFFGRL